MVAELFVAVLVNYSCSLFLIPCSLFLAFLFLVPCSLFLVPCSVYCGNEVVPCSHVSSVHPFSSTTKPDSYRV